MLNIAIDGPIAAGKTTLAKGLAKALNISYFDTGNMYRAVAVYCKLNNVFSEQDVKRALSDIEIDVKFRNGKQETILNNKIIDDNVLKTEEVGLLTSKISAYQCVREKLITKQRQIADEMPIVMEGRDIGSFVLYKAPYKFYINGTEEVRAKRKLKELQEKGIIDEDFDSVLIDINRRDSLDRSRSVSPLIMAQDAIHIDSTEMTIEEVLKFCLRKIKESKKDFAR